MSATCDDPVFRQFDFWLGDWDVHAPDGKLAGHNRITREYAGCVIHERYTTERGYQGESLNTYDIGRRVWHQTWVDNEGALLVLEGGLREGKMTLTGESVATNGKRTRHRITWTAQADGSVRQFWESTDDAGQESKCRDGQEPECRGDRSHGAAAGHWIVAFDGRYTRRKP